MNEPCAVITVPTSTSTEMLTLPTLVTAIAACTSEQKIPAVSVTSIFVLNS
jgi:hypothetical protein